jgi:hypothetical protein
LGHLYVQKLFEGGGGTWFSDRNIDSLVTITDPEDFTMETGLSQGRDSSMIESSSWLSSSLGLSTASFSSRDTEATAITRHDDKTIRKQFFRWKVFLSADKYSSCVDFPLLNSVLVLNSSDIKALTGLGCLFLHAILIFDFLLFKQYKYYWIFRCERYCIVQRN